MYRAADFFMIRVPFLDIQEFYKFIESNDDILTFIKNQKYYLQFKEALLIASDSLFDALTLYENNNLTDNKKIRNLKIAILKYFLRSVSRATPFGCFSSVCFGFVGQETNLKTVSNLGLRKRVRPDMELIHEVIKDIEKDSVNLENMLVIFNPSVYFDEYRAYLSYKTNDKNNGMVVKSENISIKKMSYFNLLLIILKLRSKFFH